MITKSAHSTKRHKRIRRALARVGSIYPVERHRLQGYNSAEDLYRDWQSVGEDFWAAIARIEKTEVPPAKR